MRSNGTSRPTERPLPATPRASGRGIRSTVRGATAPRQQAAAGLVGCGPAVIRRVPLLALLRCACRDEVSEGLLWLPTTTPLSHLGLIAAPLPLPLPSPSPPAQLSPSSPLRPPTASASSAGPARESFSALIAESTPVPSAQCPSAKTARRQTPTLNLRSSCGLGSDPTFGWLPARGSGSSPSSRPRHPPGTLARKDKKPTRNAYLLRGSSQTLEATPSPRPVSTLPPPRRFLFRLCSIPSHIFLSALSRRLPRGFPFKSRPSFHSCPALRRSQRLLREIGACRDIPEAD